MRQRVAWKVLPLALVMVAVLTAGGLSRAADREIEKAAAFSGYGYTVIGRVFLGDDGNLSYLRFLNLSGSTSTVNATLIGSPSGRNYGTVNVGIQNHASRQIPITQFLSDAGVPALISPDDRLGVYLRSDGAPVAVQHVLFSQATGFFENMSTCQNSSVSDSNAALMNVHTSLITDYVSYVTIYNYTSVPASYEIQVYEGGSGAFKGQVVVSVDANSTFEQPFEWFQQQLDWTPASTEGHANIVAFPKSGGRGALIFHTVYNSKVGVFLNLTNFCTIESSVSTLPVVANDNISGISVGQPFTIDFSTLTANDQNISGGTLTEVTNPSTSSTANGTLTQSGNNLTYTAARSGIATFQYRIHTNAGTSSSATVTLNVSDGAPVTDGDRLTQTFTAGSPSTIALSALISNDHNTAGATLTNVTAPQTEGTANGTITLSGEGLIFTPARNGTAAFQYQLRNSLGTSNAATVTLTVGGGAAPVAKSDTLTQTFVVGQQTSIALSALTANDSNTAGASLESVTTPTTDGTGNGTITRTNDGVTYTPTRQGTAIFSYQLRNSAGVSNTATVTVTVNALTTNAVPLVPSTSNDTLTQEFIAGKQSTILLATLTANDKNATGAFLGTLTTPTTDGAANGTLTATRDGITYTPTRAGQVSFTYFIYTSAGISNVSQVNLTVGGGALVPVTSADTLTRVFTAGQQTTISLSDLAANDKNTTGGFLENLSTPTTNGTANGTLTRTGDGILYTPSRAGSVTFTYQIRTNAGISNVSEVTLTVIAATNSN